MVDFRNYNYGLDKLIADNAYDQLLVLYSFDSFKSDPYLYRAGAAADAGNYCSIFPQTSEVFFMHFSGFLWFLSKTLAQNPAL